MRFLVCRASQGAVSKKSPCPGAVRGPEAGAWPGEFPWFIELATLEELVAFLNETLRSHALLHNVQQDVDRRVALDHQGFDSPQERKPPRDLRQGRERDDARLGPER